MHAHGKIIRRCLGMKEVAVRGFLFDPEQSVASSAPAAITRDGWVVVHVKLPEDLATIDCNWLMEAANQEFTKAGVQMRLVGLLSPAEDELEDAEDCFAAAPSWMIDPATLLDTMDLTKELEAVFICEKLCVKTTTGKPSKVTASDFEFIRLLGAGAEAKVFQVRRRKTDKMYAVCSSVSIFTVFVLGKSGREEGYYGRP